MLLASVKLGSSPASEALSASAVHLFKRAAASGEGCPHSSISRSMRRPSTAAFIITRRYACAESKPSSLALVVNFLRIVGSNGTCMVDVSLIHEGYQIVIIMSTVEYKNLQAVGLEPKSIEVGVSLNATGALQSAEASLLSNLVQRS